MSKKIKIDEMGKEIAQIFREYAKATNETCVKAVKETCEETVRQLQSTSPRDHGNYAGSWKYGSSPFKKDKAAKIIYNREHYRLTHLLENGHKKVNGGMVPGKPHIRPAAEKAERIVLQKIKDGIKRQ